MVNARVVLLCYYRVIKMMLACFSVGMSTSVISGIESQSSKPNAGAGFGSIPAAGVALEAVVIFVFGALPTTVHWLH